MTNVLRIDSVVFKRTEKGKWERGILVNEGDGPMIDMQGKVIPAGGVWDWRATHDHVVTIAEQES